MYWVELILYEIPKHSLQGIGSTSNYLLNCVKRGDYHAMSLLTKNIIIIENLIV